MVAVVIGEVEEMMAAVVVTSKTCRDLADVKIYDVNVKCSMMLESTTMKK